MEKTTYPLKHSNPEFITEYQLDIHTKQSNEIPTEGPLAFKDTPKLKPYLLRIKSFSPFWFIFNCLG